jgi:hypothetical protein
MGVFVCIAKPSKAMQEVCDHSGSFVHPMSGTAYPKVQIITVADLLAGKKPDMPTPILPYKLAKKASGQMSLLD